MVYKMFVFKLGTSLKQHNPCTRAANGIQTMSQTFLDKNVNRSRVPSGIYASAFLSLNFFSAISALLINKTLFKKKCTLSRANRLNDQDRT